MHEFLNTCILYYILMNMSIPKMNKNAVFIKFFHVSTANGSIIERLYFCIYFTNISEFVGEDALPYKKI